MSRNLALAVAVSVLVVGCRETSAPIAERHNIEVVPDTIDLSERRALTILDLVTGGSLRPTDVTVRSLDTLIVGVVGPEQTIEGRAAGKATIEVRRVVDAMDVARVSVTVRSPRVRFLTPLASIELGRVPSSPPS